MKKKWTKDLYCQFLLASQRNFTATQAADLTRAIAFSQNLKQIRGTEGRRLCKVKKM